MSDPLGEYIALLASDAAMRVPVKQLTTAIAVAESEIRRAEDALDRARERRARAVARLDALRAAA